MSFNILNADVTDKVISRTVSSASITDIVSILVQSRDYRLADNVGEYNPFASAGLLFKNSWRNQVVQETEVNGREVFRGPIKKVGMLFDNIGFQTTISARESVGTLLDFVVEENDITTHANFLVNGAASAGSQTITIDTGTTDIQNDLPAQVTFSTDLFPRYQITAATGSPTTSITLDRPLEQAVADNTALRVSIPVFKTPAGAIYDALVSVNLGDRIGSSFANIDATDASANRYLKLHIRTEDNIQLSKHIATLLDLGNLSLTVNSSGVVDVIRNIAFDGTDIIDRITGAEILEPVSITFDDSKLVIGYDLLYLDSTTETVKVASGDVDQTIIDEYAGLNRWQPIQANSSLAIDYNYLYNTSTTADYFGGLRLDYYGVPRVRVRSGLKQSIFNNTLKRFQVQLGKNYALNMPIATNQNFIDEPTRVVSFTYNENEQRFDSIELELTNYPSPNIPRNVSSPSTPLPLASYAINEGIVTVFESFSTNLELWIQIYLEDMSFKVDETELSYFEQGDGNFYAMYTDSLINNGTTYFARYYIKSGGINSAKTDFIEFIPVDNGTALWGSSSAWNFAGWGS